MKKLLTEWKIYINEVKADFDKATGCWFYTMLDDSNVPEHILSVLEDNAIKVAEHKNVRCDRTLADCMVVPNIWLKIFKENGIKAKIQNGFYISEEWDDESGSIERFLSGYSEFPSSTDHNWLIVEGQFLFDPTACQFGDDIKLERYVTNKNKRYIS